MILAWASPFKVGENYHASCLTWDKHLHLQMTIPDF